MNNKIGICLILDDKPSQEVIKFFEKHGWCFDENIIDDQYPEYVRTVEITYSLYQDDYNDYIDIPINGDIFKDGLLKLGYENIEYQDDEWFIDMLKNELFEHILKD